MSTYLHLCHFRRRFSSSSLPLFFVALLLLHHFFLFTISFLRRRFSSISSSSSPFLFIFFIFCVFSSSSLLRRGLRRPLRGLLPLPPSASFCRDTHSRNTDMEGEHKYPKRVLSSGFRTNKSINHYCTLKKMTSMRDYIGADAYDDIERNSQLGIILQFAGSRFSWASKYVQHLLGNMLDTPNVKELWVMADTQPIRFSLNEFQQITQLQCGLPDPNDAGLAVGDLWSDMGLVHGDGPKWAELEGVLKVCKDWEFAKRKMVGLLVVLYVGVFGLHTNSRIPVYYAKLVMDSARFERHPWGRVAFEALLKSVSQASRSTSTLNLHGFVHVLLIWAFEYIPQLGIMCGGKREGQVPLMQWASRINRGVDMVDVFKADKLASGEDKVRVVHLLVKPYDEIYPEWPVNVVDPKVDKLIRDILDGSLDNTFWSIPGPSKEKKPEKKRSADVSPRELRSGKKAKTKETPKEKESLEDITLAEYVSKEKASKERLERKWKKEFEKNMMYEMLESMKKAFDVIVYDQVNLKNTVKLQSERLEEKRIDEAVVDERLRRLEVAMEQQNSINLRLLDLLDRKQPEAMMSLEEAKKSDPVDEGETTESERLEEAVGASSGKKSVRKSLLDFE